MKVTLLPIRTINVRTNQKQQQVVSSTTQFIGAQASEAKIAEALALAMSASDNANNALLEANTALNLAQVASYTANTKLSITGGEITGNLMVDGSFTAVVDAGDF